MALQDILVSGATVLYSPVGTSLPNISSVNFNTYGGWTGWTSMGITTSPTVLRFDREIYMQDAQQYAQPIMARVVGKRISVRFEIAELTSGIWALLMDDAGANNVSPGVGQKGYFEIDTGSDLTTYERQFAFEGFRLDSDNTKQPVRFFVYKAILRLEGDITFSKRDGTRARCVLDVFADTGKAQNADVAKLQVVTAPAS